MKDNWGLIILGIICSGLILMHAFSVRWFLLERVSAEMLVSDTMRYAYEGSHVIGGKK